MNLKISDLMAKRVITAQPHHSVAHVRELLEKHRLHAIPIVGPEGESLGIVSASDLARKLKDLTPISRIMTRDVRTVPEYNDVTVAAKIMRKNRLHRLVVTKEKRVIGVISAFDLLKLIEGHRFVMKNAPKTGAKKARTAKKK